MSALQRAQASAPYAVLVVERRAGTFATRNPSDSLEACTWAQGVLMELAECSGQFTDPLRGDLYLDGDFYCEIAVLLDEAAA